MSTPSAEPGSAAALGERLRVNLDALLAGSDVPRLLVAYSGGLDSTVLLHLLREYCVKPARRLEAHHVDHALQADSAGWARRCAAIAAKLGVPFSSQRLTQSPSRGASIEAWAREARYAALLARCDARSALVTAHHQDDQAETVLLAALRGSGPHGLAAIRAAGEYHGCRVWRPLLNMRRDELLAYAQALDLEWLEDPSNGEPRFARNRLRATVLPLLEREFPGASKALAQVAILQAEVVTVLDALADRVLDGSQVLELALLRDCTPAMRPFLLKRWLARGGAVVPGRAQIEGLLDEALTARHDALPVIAWRGCAVRRFKDRFYLTAAAVPPPAPDPQVWAAPWSVLELPHGELRAAASDAPGLDRELLANAILTVRHRVGGERLRVHRTGPRRALKSLFQEWGVPPWQRASWPLLYIDEQLAAVPGHAVAVEFRAADAESALSFTWRPRAYSPHD